MRPDFQGSLVPLPTPFRGGELDLPALRRLVERQIGRGASALVPLGTTGETPTLTSREYALVLETTIAEAAGRLPVVTGVGTNATRTTVERARFAERAGADGLLVVTPYYNRPSPRGLYRHFASVAEATELPVALYNVPSRTGVDLGADVAAMLRASFPHVVAIKEASTRLERVAELAAIDGLAVLCGEDALIGPFVRAGAVGAVAVTANVLPEDVAAWIADPRSHELEERVVSMASALFSDVNPVPVKAALAELGLCEDEVRLPLVTLEPEGRARIREALAALRAPSRTA